MTVSQAPLGPLIARALRLINFYAEDYPLPDDVKLGQLYPVDDTDIYWLAILTPSDALVAIGGRENTKLAIACARMLGKPVYAFTAIPGAARDVLANQQEMPNFLRDRGMPPKEMANRLAQELRRRYELGINEQTAKQRGGPFSQENIEFAVRIWKLIRGNTLRRAAIYLVLAAIAAQVGVVQQLVGAALSALGLSTGTAEPQVLWSGVFVFAAVIFDRLFPDKETGRG